MSGTDVWTRAYLDDRFARPQGAPHREVTAADIARVFAVPLPMVGLPDTEPKRDRLRLLIADMQGGYRCKRCAGYSPLDAVVDSPDVCRCGAQW